MKVDRRKFNGSERRLPDYQCPGCGMPFRPHWNGQKFCGNKCRLKHLHNSRREIGEFFNVVCWKKEEDEVIRNMWPNPDNSFTDLMEKLPGRTSRAISHRKAFLGVKRDWIKYGHPGLSSSRKEYLSNLFKGRNNPFYGRRHSDKAKKEMSETLKKSSAFHRLNKDPEFQKKRRKAWIAAVTESPNKKERILNDILQKLLPGWFKFTGDGEFIIDRMNPDFVCEKRRLVIELFGRVFHDPEFCGWKVPKRGTEKGRKAALRKAGYRCLVVWEEELSKRNRQNLEDRIANFIDPKGI